MSPMETADVSPGDIHYPCLVITALDSAVFNLSDQEL